MSPVQLPAEWEKYTGVLLSWPAKSTDWCNSLDEVEATYLELTRQIAKYSQVYVCCSDPDTMLHVQQLCNEHNITPGKLNILSIPYDDTWVRDYGPISVRRNNEIVWLHFKFNAWGGRYPYQQDTRLTRLLYRELFINNRILIDNTDFVLEAGSIDCDGIGTILTTSRCLLSAGRNPGLTKRQIEDRLISTFGIQRVLWLEHGQLAGDDTDAHIDTLARFCSPDTIAYVQCSSPVDPHYESLSEMEKQLESFVQMNGNPYRLIPLPLPDACFNKKGQRLPATYANFLIINGAVLVPVYELNTDSLALAQLHRCFPKHTIIPIQCRALLEQFGSLHCITMQIL